MTIAELIARLSSFPSTAEIAGTYEGIIRGIDDVYQLPDGSVLIDVDGGFYKSEFLKGNND